MGDQTTRDQLAAAYPRHRLLAQYLENILHNICARSDVKVDHITSRAKDIDSAFEKIRNRNYRSYRQVKDLCGVRIIVRHLSEIPRVRDIIRAEFLVESEKDQTSPQADVFGYSGYHLIVKLSPERASLIENEVFENLRAEVQIRTILQHAWASISHSFDYKSEAAAPIELKRDLHMIAGLLESGDKLFDQYKDKVESLTFSPTSNSLLERSVGGLSTDSLSAAEFRWHDLSATAEAAGWRKFARLEGRLTNKREREANERIIEAANIFGYRNVDELVKERLSIEPAFLGLIAKEGMQRKYVPFAIGPDILGLYLCAVKAQEAMSKRSQLADIYRPELLEASISAGIQSSNSAS